MKFSLVNLFSLVTIVALSTALVCVLLEKDRVVSVRSDYDHYYWLTRETLLDASPVWPEAELNPPLTVRGALNILDDVVANLNVATKPVEIGDWELQALYISPLNGFHSDETSTTKWCYVAQLYGGSLTMSTSGPLPKISIMILMDGSVYVGEGSTNAGVENAIRQIYPGDGGV